MHGRLGAPGKTGSPPNATLHRRGRGIVYAIIPRLTVAVTHAWAPLLRLKRVGLLTIVAPKMGRGPSGVPGVAGQCQTARKKNRDHERGRARAQPVADASARAKQSAKNRACSNRPTSIARGVVLATRAGVPTCARTPLARNQLLHAQLVPLVTREMDAPAPMLMNVHCTSHAMKWPCAQIPRVVTHVLRARLATQVMPPAVRVPQDQAASKHAVILTSA